MARKTAVQTEEVVEAVKVEDVAAEETAPKKTRAKRTTKKIEMVLQFQGNEATIASIEEKVKAKFVEEGHKVGEIKTLTVYVKPEEAAAYYVINEEYKGRIELF